MLDAIHDSLFDIRMAFPLFLGGGGPTSQYLESLASSFKRPWTYGKVYFYDCFILFSRRLLHVLDKYKAVLFNQIRKDIIRGYISDTDFHPLKRVVDYSSLEELLDD